jgi:hypothetical protein
MAHVQFMEIAGMGRERTVEGSMKTIIIALILGLAVQAGAGEPLIEADSSTTFLGTGERYPMSSSNCLWDENGKLMTQGGENCGGYMEYGRYVEESCTPCPDQIERFSWTVDSTDIATLTPIRGMGFEDAGTLTWEGGVFKFSGNPDASAVVFLDWMQQHYNSRQEMYCQPKSSELLSILELARTELIYLSTECERHGNVNLCGASSKRPNKLLQDIEAMIERMK